MLMIYVPNEATKERATAVLRQWEDTEPGFGGTEWQVEIDRDVACAHIDGADEIQGAQILSEINSERE